MRAACAALVVLLLAPAAAWARTPALVSRAGEDPDVAVDAAGTGHFVWSRTIGDVTTTQYCRIKRRKHACAPGSRHQFHPGPRNPPGGNRDFDGPRIFLNGQTVVVVTHRCCGAGVGTDFEVTFRFVSRDGGRTFDRGRLIGTTELGAAVLGPGETLNAMGSNGDVDVQTAPLAGPVTTAEATILRGDFFFNGGIGFAGTQLVVGISDGTTAFTARTVGPQPNDAGSWRAQPDGAFIEIPALAGGPAGLFELAADGDDRIGWRRYDPATGLFGAPQFVAPDGIFGAGTQDAAGRLHASWEHFGALRYSRSAPGGASFERARAVVRSGSGFFNPAIAAGPTGLGWIAWDSLRRGRVRAIAVP
jgi:hypothetical protein